MSYAYSPNDAAQFILGFGALPVIGGPIQKDGWFSDLEIRTLADFVEYRYPPWGVIVRPGGGRDVLVSYDARGMLHVIEVTREPIVSAVIQAPVESPSLASIVVERTREVIDASGSVAKQAGFTVFDALARLSASIEKAIPNPAAAFSNVALLAGIGVLILIVSSGRKRQ